MTSNLSYIEYITFIISFPYTNISKLVEIDSTIKTPNVREFMNIDDYEIYKKQMDEKKIYNNQIYEHIKNENNANNNGEIITGLNNEKIKKLIDERDNICKNHLKFDSYFLMPNSILWSHHKVCQ